MDKPKCGNTHSIIAITDCFFLLLLRTVSSASLSMYLDNPGFLLKYN